MKRTYYDIISTATGHILKSKISWTKAQEILGDWSMREIENGGHPDHWDIVPHLWRYKVYVTSRTYTDRWLFVGMSDSLHGAKSIAGRNRISANYMDNDARIFDTTTLDEITYKI